MINVNLSDPQMINCETFIRSANDKCQFFKDEDSDPKSIFSTMDFSIFIDLPIFPISLPTIELWISFPTKIYDSLRSNLFWRKRRLKEKNKERWLGIEKKRYLRWILHCGAISWWDGLHGLDICYFIQLNCLGTSQLSSCSINICLLLFIPLSSPGTRFDQAAV